jgi:hypothetical protein
MDQQRKRLERLLRALHPVVAGLPLLLFAPSVRGQDSSAKAPPVIAHTGKAQILGIVVDSLHGRYLTGADVVVEGAKSAVQTDSLGKFKLDSLPPGTFQVGVFHPLLDTLDIVLLTAPFHVGPDSAGVVVLGVPSAPTIIHRACPRKTDASAGSAVIGHVNDPESLAPVPGAEVSVGWTELQVSKSFGIRRTPHVLRDTTDKMGSFRICGLPSGLSASMQARRGSAATAEIPIEIGDGPFQVFVRTLSLSAVESSAARTGNASVSGVVQLEGSSNNAGTRVELTGTDIVAMTNEKGEFVMQNLPSGTGLLLARHLGFSAETTPVELSSHQPQRVTMKLSKYVAMMDPVLVTARRTRALDKVGFNQRQRSGFGRYIGPEQLERMHAIQLTDILRRVPGLRVISSAGGEVVESSRGPTTLNGSECVQFWVDDAPWTSFTPGDVNLFVNGGEVVAVEVYQGAGVPPQYQRSLSDCTTIVIWTRFKIRN